MSSPESDERFVALLLANQNRIFRFLVTLVPCRSDAEDLLQQTCLTLWQSREKFDPAAGGDSAGGALAVERGCGGVTDGDALGAWLADG